MVIINFFSSALGLAMLVFGAFCIMTSIIGIIRMPDFFTRLQTASLNDSFGMPIFLIGIAILQPSLMMFFKIVILAIFSLILSPLVSHMLIKAAWTKSEETKMDDKSY